MKTCTNCNETKPPELFSACRKNPDGKQYHCKACNAAAHREYVDANPGCEARYQEARREGARLLANLGDWDKYARLRLAAMRKRAQKRGIDFELKPEDIVPLYEAGCALTGYQFSNLAKDRSPLSPSIDRIDSSKGYVRGNIRAVCYALNIGMNDWGFEKIAPLWKAAIEHSAGPL